MLTDVKIWAFSSADNSLDFRLFNVSFTFLKRKAKIKIVNLIAFKFQLNSLKNYTNLNFK